MNRTTVLTALALVLLVGCGGYGGGGGGGGTTASPTPRPTPLPTLGPTGEVSAPPLVLATPTPEGTLPPGATVSRATIVEAGVRRAGFAVGTTELAELGWTIDVGQGTATFFKPELGTEHVRWAAPPTTLAIESPLAIWLTGDVTSRAASNLNLQIGLRAGGFEVADPTTRAFSSTSYYEETGAFSQAGVQADAPEVRRSIRLRANAVPGEEATIAINLGWQAQGCEVFYRYVYQP